MNRFIAVVFLALLAQQGHAQDVPRVSAQISRNGFKVSGDVEVQATRALAWEALTDYEGWARFLPDLQVSRIVSRTPLRIAQRASLPWLPGIPIVVLAEVVEQPKTKLSFSKVQGNVMFLEGEWRISGKDGALRLEYRAEVSPGVPLPANLPVELVQKDTRAKVEAMAGEILRRASQEK